MTNKQLGNLFVATIQGKACTQCGGTDDLMVGLTQYQICGKCTRKNHKKAIGKK